MFTKTSLAKAIQSRYTVGGKSLMADEESVEEVEEQVDQAVGE